MSITAIGKYLYYTVGVITHPVKHLFFLQELILAQVFVNLELNGLKAATLFAFRIKKAHFEFNLFTFLLIVIHMQKAQKTKKTKQKKKHRGD